MSPGATYSPGAWFALVAPTVAVLIDPELPGTRLDELWRAVQTQKGADPALAVLSAAASAGRPAFALAALEGSSVRLLVRGSLQVTVQDASGNERLLPPANDQIWREETLSASDVLWFVRPGGRADGVALPIVSGAVLADVLAWQAAVPAEPAQSAEPTAPAVPAVPPAQDLPRLPDRLAPVGHQPEVGPVEAVIRPRRSVSESDTRVTPSPPRRSAGLGSHPRRRYGAADWSLAPQPGGWNDEDAGSGIDSGVPDPRLAPTAPPEGNNGSAPVPETRIWQPSQPPTESPEEPPEEPAVAASERVADAPAQAEAEPDAVVRAVPEPVAQPQPKPAPKPAPKAAPKPAPDAPPVAVTPVPTPVPDTVVASAVSGAIGVLEFDDGVRVDVDGPVIIGRAPSQVEQDRPARLVPVRGATRGLSRNHVRIDVGLQGPFVVDLGSRNGTSLRNPGRAPAKMDPWMPYPLEPDAEIVFAEIICTFRAADRGPQ